MSESSSKNWGHTICSLMRAMPFKSFDFSLIFLVFLAMTVLSVDHVRAQGSPPHLLVVIAHPDDEIMAAGKLIWFKEQGFEIHAAYATFGEEGRIFGKQSSKEETTQVRKQELELAARALGITKVIYLGAPDVALRDPITQKPSRDSLPILRDYWNQSEISHKLEEEAESFKPDVILSMSLSPDSHSGHKAIRLITENIFRQGHLGPRAKSFYAIDEGDRITGEHERGSEVLHFSLDAISPLTGRTYGEMAREVESLHASQHLSLPVRPRHEELVFVSGVPNLKMHQSFTGISCAMSAMH